MRLRQEKLSLDVSPTVNPEVACTAERNEIFNVHPEIGSISPRTKMMGVQVAPPLLRGSTSNTEIVVAREAGGESFLPLLRLVEALSLRSNPSFPGRILVASLAATMRFRRVSSLDTRSVEISRDALPGNVAQGSDLSDRHSFFNISLAKPLRILVSGLFSVVTCYVRVPTLLTAIPDRGDITPAFTERRWRCWLDGLLRSDFDATSAEGGQHGWFAYAVNAGEMSGCHALSVRKEARVRVLKFGSLLVSKGSLASTPNSFHFLIVSPTVQL